jgi:predicted Zn-dependent protease
MLKAIMKYILINLYGTVVMKTFKILTLTICAGFITLALTGCYTVPISGRTTLNMVTMAEEAQLGLQAYEDAKAQTPQLKDSAVNDRVTRIGNRIAQVSHFPEWDWEFVVFDDPDIPNAWCLPGGKVAVYSGLLPYVKTDGELATVMAHEIAHAIARHGAERMSQEMVRAAGAAVVAETVGDEYVEMSKVVYGVGSDLFVMLPYSRKHELEADQIGLIYMARAGYDPNEAVTFWERFSQVGEGQKPPEFLSTHPADENRVQQIKELLPAAVEEYQKTKETTGT